MPKPALIALGLRTWANHSRPAIDGILRFGRKHGGYQFRDFVPDSGDGIASELDRLRPQGAILMLNSGDFAKLGERFPTTLPMVNIGADRIASIPFVCRDDHSVVQTAVSHLRERGYTRLAWLGWKFSTGSTQREQLCRKLVKQLDCFQVQWDGWDEPPDPHMDRGLDAWLRSLRSPVGIIAWSGSIACRLLSRCQRLQLKVPEDVGILSLADEQVCLLSEPAISALDADGETLGYEAMKLLAAHMAGARVHSPVIVKATGVIARASTGSPLANHDEIEAAREYIEKNACAGITVDNVVGNVSGMGRSRFYSAFTERFGESPANYIRRVKLEHAKRLLRESKLTVTRIAGLCGFGSQTRFGVAFKREAGVTPFKFRRAQGATRSAKATIGSRRPR